MLPRASSLLRVWRIRAHKQPRTTNHVLPSCPLLASVANSCSRVVSSSRLQEYSDPPLVNQHIAHPGVLCPPPPTSLLFVALFPRSFISLSIFTAPPMMHTFVDVLFSAIPNPSPSLPPEPAQVPWCQPVRGLEGPPHDSACVSVVSGSIQTFRPLFARSRCCAGRKDRGRWGGGAIHCSRTRGASIAAWEGTGTRGGRNGLPEGGVRTDCRSDACCEDCACKKPLPPLRVVSAVCSL